MIETLQQLTDLALRFRDARDWKQFHSPKEMALCMAVECGELLELMLWKQGDELKRHLRQHRRKIADELADVLHALLLLADEMELDLGAAFTRKMRKNQRKYPIHKARGSSRKYTEL